MATAEQPDPRDPANWFIASAHGDIRAIDPRRIVAIGSDRPIPRGSKRYYWIRTDDGVIWSMNADEIRANGWGRLLDRIEAIDKAEGFQ